MGTVVPLTEDEIENINCLFSNLDTKIGIYLSLRNEPVIDAQHMSFFFFCQSISLQWKNSHLILFILNRFLRLIKMKVLGYFSMYCLKMHELSVKVLGHSAPS